jgi:hypothetical protein
MLTSLLVLNLENFKCLIFVAVYHKKYNMQNTAVLSQKEKATTGKHHVVSMDIGGHCEFTFSGPGEFPY